MKRDEILHEVAAMITGERNATHGDPGPQFAQTAEFWSVYLGVHISREQVAVCNILQKISRSVHGQTNLDDARDTVGYGGIWGEFLSEATKASPSDLAKVLAKVSQTPPDILAQLKPCPKCGGKHGFHATYCP